MVEPYMVDMRFDSCIMFAENTPDALDSPSLPCEWRRPDFLPVGDYVAYTRSWFSRVHRPQSACVPSCNSSTWSGSSRRSRQQQETTLANLPG